MNQLDASRLLAENLHTIFAWSLSKLHDRADAEDLSQDIICAVLKSVHRLEKEEAFWGFVWRIAENTLYGILRKKRPETVEWEENFCGACWNTPENDFLKSEEIHLLRRELSLLSNQYREVTVSYYIRGMSCSEISAKLNISEGMVKYYLFKTRKILKEGIGMTREYGEKSYNPQAFQIGFWGGSIGIYWELFQRKLPGNIMLAAYHSPMTITELSVELGVATVYLEDELAILTKHDMLKKTGDKYRTNIVIFTEEYEKKVAGKLKPVYQKAAEICNKQLDALFCQLKTLDFEGNTYDDNRLKWTFLNLALYQALCQAEDFGDYPPLSNGSFGYVYGFDHTDSDRRMNGIYGHNENSDNTAWVSVENYRIIEKCQNWHSAKWQESLAAMADAALHRPADESNEQVVEMIQEGYISSDKGILSPNFPVFSETVLEQATTLLAPVIETVSNCMAETCGIAALLLKDCTPDALKEQCNTLAGIHHRMDCMAIIAENMVLNHDLLLPEDKVNLCIFGVTR